MKALNIAVLGATGAVGQEMLKILAEYDIPVNELRPLASAKSVGKCVSFKGKDVPIQEANDDAFEGLDFVLGAVEGDMSKRFAPAIKKSGAIYIDNSSAFRLDPDVPLVVPEINGADAFKNKGIIANPNCCTIIALMAVAGIHKCSPIESMIACTYQAVSGAGQNGITELNNQMAALAASMGTFSSVRSVRAMEWERRTGTRTQVQLTRRSGACRMRRPSFCIFISSLV